MLAGEGGSGVGGGQEHEEARADGGIIFYVQSSAVFSHDARGDGQAESGAAIFGGKMREEKFVFVFGRDAVASVRDANFDGVGFGVGARGDGNFADARVFESFGSVVNEIDEDAAQQVGVGANRGEVIGEDGFYDDAVEAAGENAKSFVDECVGVGGKELGAGEAHELGKFVDQIGKGGDFLFDEAGTFLDETSEFGIGGGRRGGIFAAAFEEAREALRGELNGGERIFDFVRDATGDFLPGGEFLRAQDFGEVVKDHNETGIGAARTERAYGHGEMQNAARDD